MIGIRSLHHKLIRRMLRNRRVGGGDDTGREADPVLYVCWHGGSRIPNEQQTGSRLRIYPAGSRTTIEGWVVIVTNIHEEAQEDDIYDSFAEFGDVKSLHLNLDRRTGFAKGYALLEYEERQEAEDAIASMNGQEFFTRKIKVDWAFKKAS